MMSDEIIREMWEIKDSIAKEHGYDVDRIVAYIRTRQRPKGHHVVDLRAARGASDQTTQPEDHNKCEPHA